IEWQARQLRATNARLQREVAHREEAQRDAAFEREERQRVTLASIADAVITTDQRGLVISLNPVAEQLTGWQSAQAKGHPLVQVINIADQVGESAAERSLQQALSGHVPVRDDRSHALDCENGKRYVDLSVSPVHDRLGQVIGAVMILHDITARHEIEVERSRALRFEQDARRAAEDSSRARDEFLAVISHELRTPLNAIVGWTHVLRTSGSNQSYAEQAVDAIHRSAMAQKKLIEDLLDMSRIINGKIDLQRQSVDLAAVVASAVDTLRPSADEKRVRLNCNLEPLESEAYADRVRVQQVVWNVVSNAIKFTPAGGVVNVHLEGGEEYARITVTDTGQGVGAEFLPYMFDSFRQADSSITRKQGGLGLGLAISKQLVEAHGGEIRARSEGANQGTTVELTLPLNTAKASLDGQEGEFAQAAANQDLVANGKPLAGVRVLVVDDDFNTLTLVGIALREQGALVRAVSNAAEAMRVLEEWTPKALLSDISMPDEDGYSLIRRVRETPHGRSIAAMALTAMASEEDRLRALNAGFDAHVSKPLDLSALVQTVAMQLGAAAKTKGMSD
ncbi:MAG TPA: ATP-binding protein, partial [Burkholderiales bacterium]|nr:ATP-binding protein [Burkholderiales bacterium]